MLDTRVGDLVAPFQVDFLQVAASLHQVLQTLRRDLLAVLEVDGLQQRTRVSNVAKTTVGDLGRVFHIANVQVSQVGAIVSNFLHSSVRNALAIEQSERLQFWTTLSEVFQR